ADKEDFVNVFKMLCQEEAKHKQILETIYDDFMAEQGD
ncbi:MAG: rubrerythrin, partial [Deltaproteobacteria bacterium]|nr:rubrerythrin [Deltaproteobacteria bacterium]